MPRMRRRCALRLADAVLRLPFVGRALRPLAKRHLMPIWWNHPIRCTPGTRDRLLHTLVMQPLGETGNLPSRGFVVPQDMVRDIRKAQYMQASRLYLMPVVNGKDE